MRKNTCAYCGESGRTLRQFWDRVLKDYDWAHAECLPAGREAAIKELLAPITTAEVPWP
jgi:hypothetical protein